MDREALLNEIINTDFALVDLRLFLNTHPRDKEAIARYNFMLEESKNFRTEFEHTYGAISHSSPSDSDYFSWIDNPWPWEKTFMKGDK